jgi:hypothetical protein
MKDLLWITIKKLNRQLLNGLLTLKSLLTQAGFTQEITNLLIKTMKAAQNLKSPGLSTLSKLNLHSTSLLRPMMVLSSKMMMKPKSTLRSGATVLETRLTDGFTLASIMSTLLIQPSLNSMFWRRSMRVLKIKVLLVVLKLDSPYLTRATLTNSLMELTDLQKKVSRKTLLEICLSRQNQETMTPELATLNLWLLTLLKDSNLLFPTLSRSHLKVTQTTKSRKLKKEKRTTSLLELSLKISKKMND